MDLDIEMEDVVDVNGPTQLTESYTEDIITGEEQEPGEVFDDAPSGQSDGARASQATVVPHKLYMRGLDTFNPEEVGRYLTEHLSGPLKRIEWIDDSSANFHYENSSSAETALCALAAVDIVNPASLPPLELLPAKAYSAKPDCTLKIRFAVNSDKKVSGAADRSRFYLLHPEYDPEERRRRGELKERWPRRRRGRYGGSSRRDYGRDRNSDDDDEDDDDDDDDDEQPFDVDLYDDNTEYRARRTRHGFVSSNTMRSDQLRTFAYQNQAKACFPNQRDGQSSNTSFSRRERSASPIRYRGCHERDRINLDERARREAHLRIQEKAKSLKQRLIKDNSKKELFPAKKRRQVSKELFPSMVNGVRGGKAQMDRVESTTILSSAKLVDRVTLRNGFTKERDGEFSIRGQATKQAPDCGFTIKGTGAHVRELFPDRFIGNYGKEICGEKLEGRGRQRQRAEDLFH